MTDTPLTFNFPPTSDAEWHDLLRRDLGDDFEEALTWRPLEGINLRAFYRAPDTKALPHVKHSTHGPALRTPRASAPNDWTIAQRLPLHAPDFIDRIHAALDGGADRIVAHCSQGDAEAVLAPALRRACEVVETKEATLHLDGGGNALAVLNYIGSEGPLPLSYIDPFLLEAFGHWSPAAEKAYGTYTATHAPPSFVIDGRLPHAAGLPLADELALMLASASEALATHGTELLENDPRALVLIDTSYFLEIAKLRALRLVLPQVVEAYSATHASNHTLTPNDLSIYAETSSRSHTLFDPHSNLLRAATQSAAAVIGGVEQLVVHPFRRDDHDETGNTDRWARNTQLILKHEAHLNRVIDPAAGAYYLEQATHRLAQAAWDTFQSIEAAGGLAAWAATGALKERTRAARTKRRTRIAERRDVLIGTTHYPDPDAPATPPKDTSASPATRDFDITPPDWAAPLHLSRPYDELRLRIQQLDRRPVVLVCPVGTPSMRSARATFARNIVGCLGVELIEPLGYDTISDAIDAVNEHTPDAVIWCADNDTLADLLARAPSSSLDAITCAAAPPDAIPDADTVDLLFHRRAPTLQRLQELTDAFVEREL